MTAAAPVPFPFAADFGNIAAHGARRAAEAEEQTADREAAAYAMGYDDGALAETAQNAARLTATADRISDGVAALAADLARRIEALEAEAARLALSFAGALAARSVADDPLAPVEAAFRAALGDLRAEQVVTLRVSPLHVDQIGERLAPLVAGCAALRLAVVADDAVIDGDCRIVWPAGGLTRDRAALQARLASLIDRAFPAHRDHGAAP